MAASVACHADTPAPAAPTPTAASAPTPATPPTTQPATRAADADPAAAEWLDRIAAKSATIHSFTADVRYDRVQSLQGDRQRRLGTVSYTAGPPGRFAIHITQLTADGRAEKQDAWFVFDGQWLVERDNAEKQFTKRQIVAPGTNPAAEAADPLASGEGPFVLPIKADKAAILRRFDVALAPAAADDPANSVHLRMTPKATRRTDVARVDIWYSRDTLLPVRVKTTETSEDESIIELLKAKLDEPVDPKLFNVVEPRDPGWHVEVRPWEE